ERFGLRVREEILAPVEDERELAEIGCGRSQRPRDGLLTVRVVTAHLIIECVGESGFGHGCFARHEEIELLPAQRLSFALATQQPQTLRAQEDARPFGVDMVILIRRGRRRPRRFCLSERSRGTQQSTGQWNQQATHVSSIMPPAAYPPTSAAR